MLSEKVGGYLKGGIFLEKGSYSLHHNNDVLNVFKVNYKGGFTGGSELYTILGLPSDLKIRLIFAPVM